MTVLYLKKKHFSILNLEIVKVKIKHKMTTGILVSPGCGVRKCDLVVQVQKG